ncbi:MAG: hypothetical protein ACLRP3_22285 [Escherichia sp.]
MVSLINVGCLLGELYDNRSSRDGGFLMYAAGNVGSVIAPIACGFARKSTVGRWAAAAVGMIAGLVIFLCGNVISFTAALTKVPRATTFSANWGWLLDLLVATPALITRVVLEEWSVYALIVATMLAAGF